MIKKFAICLSLFTLCFSGNAYSLETKARNVILMDYETGAYLFTKEHQQIVAPASMSKLMTVYMLFEKLKDGSLSPDDEFTVSENAWRTGGAASGGSTMFLKVKSSARVEDLLKGIIIQSGNDACIVVAENIGGSEATFAEMMNEKAKELGMNNSHFANSTGLPHPDHRMAVEDLAKLSRILISEFPEYYHLFSEKSFTYNNIKQGNRNPLLYSMPFADGLKTGHTEEAGFSLTASAKKGDRRLISVMTGMSSNKERAEESDKIMNWGFREFDNYYVLRAGQKVADVPVWLGKSATVGLYVKDDIKQTLQKSEMNKVKMTVVYDKPAKAPIKKGDELGYIRIDIPNQEVSSVPVYAGQDVDKLGLFGRISHNIEYLLFGAQ